MSKQRFRWWLWEQLCKFRNVCPATAHSVCLYGERVDPRIDWACRRDVEQNGACWCGKVRPASSPEEPTP